MFTLMRNIIFVLCNFTCFSFATPIEKETGLIYHHVISLGDMCQVAKQLSLHHCRKEAFPFDWIMCPFDGLYRFIANQAEHFLDRDTLIFVDDRPDYIGGKRSFIEDTVYRMQFLHDFEKPPYFLRNYDKIKAKYDRRVDRFFKVLNSDKNVLFIRRGITYEETVLLDDLIHARYPQLNYTILALNSKLENYENWGLKRVINLYLKEKKPWHWTGDKEAWTEILNQFEIEPCDDGEDDSPILD